MLFILNLSCHLGFLEIGNNLIMCEKKINRQIILNLHILNNVVQRCSSGTTHLLSSLIRNLKLINLSQQSMSVF